MSATSPQIVPDSVKWPLWALCAAYVGLVIFQSHLNHDVAWILYASREMLAGAQFGRDVIDVNPPLIWWLSMPVIVLSQALEITLATAFRFCILALMALSLVLVKKCDKTVSGWQLAFIAAALILMPGYDFGQREHIMLILVLPYLMSALSRQDDLPRGLKILTGILAGIGFCLKPYFLLIPAAVELARWIVLRDFRSLFRTQTFVMGSIGIIYVATALVLAPMYFSHVLPVAMVSYPVYNNPPLVVLTALLTRSFQALFAFAATWYAKASWHNALALPVAAGAAAMAVVVQSKGWNYHILPVSFLLVVAVILVAGRVKNTFVYGVGLVFAGFAVVVPAAIHGYDTYAKAGEQTLITSVAQRMKSDTGPRKVYAFILSPRVIWPAIVAADAHWSDTTCCAYLLPAAVNEPTNTKAVANAEQFLTRLLKQLRREKPQMILIDTRKRLIAIKKPDFTIENYLAAHKGWAQFLSHYHPAKPVGYYKLLVSN